MLKERGELCTDKIPVTAKVLVIDGNSAAKVSPIP